MQRLNDAEIAALLKVMTPQQKLEFLEELEEQGRRVKLKKAQTSMISFAHEIYPGFKEGAAGKAEKSSDFDDFICA